MPVEPGVLGDTGEGGFTGLVAGLSFAVVWATYGERSLQAMPGTNPPTCATMPRFLVAADAREATAFFTPDKSAWYDAFQRAYVSDQTHNVAVHRGRAVAFHPAGAVLVVGDDLRLFVIEARCLRYVVLNTTG